MSSMEHGLDFRIDVAVIWLSWCADDDYTPVRHGVQVEKCSHALRAHCDQHTNQMCAGVQSPQLSTDRSHAHERFDVHCWNAFMAE